MTWSSSAKAGIPSASLASQGSARGTSVYPQKEEYVLLTKATSKAVQNGGVFTGLLMEQKMKVSFSTEGLQHLECAKHRAAPLLLPPRGGPDTIAQLLHRHALPGCNSGWHTHRYSHALRLGKHLMVNRALSKTSNLPNQLPMKYFGSNISNYYFHQ